MRTRTLEQVLPGVDEIQVYAGEDGWVPTDWAHACPRHTGDRMGACVHGISGGGAFETLGCETVSFGPFEIESGY